MEPIRKRKLYQDVLDRLILAISTKEFPPGSKLPSERELMMLIGVGRPAIREAMLSLQQMGLIKISHGERARVINPTPEAIIDQISSAMIMMLATNSRGLEDLKEARVLLETGLVRQATRNATAHDLDRLAAALRTLQDARGDHQRFVAADMAFHGIIADMAGNPLIAAVAKGMLEWLSRFKRDMVSVRGAERVTVDEHEKLYKAIAGGDADAAAQIMTDHLTRASALYSQLGVDFGKDRDT
ncbi:transcriptional regulator NanR [Mongoliimonas terrestris]|uniref:transcriptional regulator NanR n=1 Tax=Mongoliimonas terrestris TaxID=1709001 RepID=UPI000B2B26C7|nr:transcriptional regulator NanR [Mongoliimonas terrestris]